MKRGSSALMCALAFAACAGSDGPSERPPAAPPPNIVLMVADDLGWVDVSFHAGGDVQTPNIDQIAEEGVQLERFLTAPVCSPTRMGMLTGRYPIRWGMQRTVVRPWETRGLPNEEETLAEALGGQGYRHRAIMGKWHIGHAETDHHPLAHGFTEFYGSYNGAVDYTGIHQRYGERDWHRDYDSAPEDDDGYITELVAAEAVRFIAEHADDEQPFFLYLPFQAPHAPYEAPGSCKERNMHLDGVDRVYAGVITCLDDAVGEVLAALEDGGLSEETFVVFISDNGGTRGNGTWRAGKGEVFEGGVRVVAAMRWPAGGIDGGRTVSALGGYLDILPTLRSAARVGSPPLSPLDGHDLLPLLRGERRAREPDRPWFAYIVEDQQHRLSMTEGPWKLMWLGPDPGEAPDPAEAKLLLFDLEGDPGEERDLSDREPERVERMLEHLLEFRAMRPSDGLSFGTMPPEGWTPPTEWALSPP